MRWLLMPMAIGAGSLMVIQAACNSALEGVGSAGNRGSDQPLYRPLGSGCRRVRAGPARIAEWQVGTSTLVGLARLVHAGPLRCCRSP